MSFWQKLLGALASTGLMLAQASKNPTIQLVSTIASVFLGSFGQSLAAPQSPAAAEFGTHIEAAKAHLSKIA